MAATVVLLLALLALPAARAAEAAAAAPLAPETPAARPTEAAAATCQSFSRSSPSLPALVRDWFVHSSDERVVLCAKPAAAGAPPKEPAYFGEGLVTQQGGVCSYHSHGLTLIGSGERARLERYERSERAEALDMTVAAGSECPAPHAGAGAVPYVETYDVTASAFRGIMRLWAATASGLSEDRAATQTVHITPDARAQLEAALTPERASSATVTRIVRIPGRALRQRYALFLLVPPAAAASPAQYVLYLDKPLRKPYEITAFSETN